MARNRYLCLTLIPLVLLGIVSCESQNPIKRPFPPPPPGSPAEVVGGSIHVCSTTPINQASDPYFVDVDDNSKVKVSHVEFPHAPPTFTHTWKIILSNRDHGKKEKDDAVTLTSSGTTQIKIHLRGDSIWLPSTGPTKLKFHDRAGGCGPNENRQCDRLVNITFVTTDANGTTATTKGKCKTGMDADGTPDGMCSIVIGTPPAPMACDQ